MIDYGHDDQGFHGSTADTVFLVNCTGSDGEWKRQEWTEVEDDLYGMIESTVDDCEQEINEGGHFADDDVRIGIVDELYEQVLASTLRQLADSRESAVPVDPWYAKLQRCTWTFYVKVRTYEEVYG